MQRTFVLLEVLLASVFGWSISVQLHALPRVNHLPC